MPISVNTSGGRIELPEILYKYYSFGNPGCDYGIEFLESGLLYFSSPSDFNDPFDCRAYIRYEDLELESYVNYVLKSEAGKEIQKRNNWSDEEYRLLKYSEASSMSVEERAKKFASSSNLHAMKAGVFCASQNCNSILMWSHYSKHHKGFCIGLDTRILLENLSNSKVEIVKVDYRSEYPFINPQDDSTILDIFRVKHADWSYEQEFRFIALNGAFKRIQLHHSVFKEVILGAKILNNDSDKIKLITQMPMYNFQLKKAEIPLNSFRLDIKPMAF